MNIDKLHYISQAAVQGSHLEAIKNVLDAGCKWVQLRVKEQSQEVILGLAMEANSLCKQYQAKLIVNDYPEIAFRSAAFGVHLGLDDMPVHQAREILGKEKCIGGTANTFEDILLRAAEGVDYIGLGPFRFTTTKKNLSPILGLDGYKRLMHQVVEAGITIPIIAIGGIDMPDIAVILETGIYGVAVSGLLTKETDLQQQFSLIKQEIDLHSKKDEYANHSR